MLTGFKNFLMRGDVIVVAVGLVVALAFSNLVKAFTDNIINPLIASAQGGVKGPGLGWQLVNGGGDATYLNLGDKRSEVQICGIATAVDQLPAQARPLNAALGRRDERIDDVVSECFDEIAERQGHDQSNGDNDNIAAHQEVFEAREHGNSSS